MVHYQTGEGQGHFSRRLQATAQGVSAHFCQLWDWGGRGVFHSDSLSFLQLLAVASWGSGLILLEGSLHTATNSFVTRVRWEGPS